MSETQARLTVLANRLFAADPRPIKLGFTITADGTVKDVTVEESSGDDTLDALAARCATLWRYKPAMQNGHPVEVQWHAQIGWRIN